MQLPFLLVVAVLVALLGHNIVIVVVAEDANNNNSNDNNNDDSFEAFTNTVGGCDTDSISDDIPLSKLTPNQFYKICPSQLSSHIDLGRPICGDGTNFSFFMTKPIQRKANTQKILIEFMGGGACWDDETCDMNSYFTTFPTALNDFVGYSCTEMAYAMDDLDGTPISILCATSIGDTDFSEYTTIYVPYCTQDIHIGDSVNVYGGSSGDDDDANAAADDDGNSDNDSMIFNHHGGHNTMGVLRWIFRNFNSPSHIVLTGCSAGGTAVPIVYDLVRKHYNKARRTVQITTLADSPVYLTPPYFLTNLFELWNPGTIMNHVGFQKKFEQVRYSDDYPTRAWQHLLKRGSNKDEWGFISHTDDPISLQYYQWMAGNGNNDGRQRRLADDDGGGSQWYSELTASLNTITNKHKNVKEYWIEDEGHCSFGLYYPLQVDGFASWAGDLLKEQRGVGGHSTPAAGLLFLSVAMGALVWVGATYASRKQQRQIVLDDDADHSNNEGGVFSGFLRADSDGSDGNTKDSKSKARPVLDWCAASGSIVSTYSITAAYALAVTMYFWTMMISQGFAHPLNNPSLGPSAISLSGFGINNPSLIAYNKQIFRLVTSSFLCSGIITYLIVLLCLWFYVKPLEQMLHNHLYFGTISIVILLGSNLVYALFANGASCSSVALVLGLNTVYIILRRRLEDSSIVGIAVSTIFLKLLVCFAFPFNSWIMLLSGVVMGVLSATVVIVIASKEPRFMQDDDVDGIETTSVMTSVNPVKVSKRGVAGIGGTLVVLFFVVLFRKPEELYLEAFYTGCNVMYAAGDDVSSVVNNYQDSFRRLTQDTEEHHHSRQLSGDDNNNYDDMCAQFCIPHIASTATVYGANRMFGLPLTRGLCQDIGYDEHMADKTYQVSGYSLDFEVFTLSEEEEENGGEGR